MQTNRSVTHFFILFVVLFLIYSNTLHSPWVLDDQSNILDNLQIHLQQLSWQEIKNTFFAYPDSPGRLYRPISCLSLSLNWFVGQADPFGYHIVNISIHISTTFFLYITCLKLLQVNIPSVSYCSCSGNSIALLAALLWAINPIQTQAVTYIVQRMAALAAMFSIISIFFFLKARTAASVRNGLLFGLCCLISFFLALGSKENAILLPFSLILIDCIFFKSHCKFATLKKTYYFFLAIIFLCVVYIFFSEISLPGLNYEHRTFTLTQRTLASPYILLVYLSLLFYPLASRLSIEHDIFLSDSLLSHWTTLPSLGLCIFLLITAFFLRKKKALFSFAILFYFLNHIVESTIFHLEPFFEHRNYLPSLFLFLPISAEVVAFIDCPQKKYIRMTLFAASTFFLIFLGINTYTRNQVWGSAMSIWLDALNKAPKSSRAAINLAKEYVNVGDTEMALILSQRSYNMWHPTKKYAQAISLNGQGVIANIRGEYQKASQLFKKSLGFVPDYGEARKNLILILCKQYLFHEALSNFSHYPDRHLKGVVLLWLGHAKKALEEFRLSSQTLDIENITGIGKAFSMLGEYELANFYLKQAAPFSPLSNLIQIENLLYAKKINDAKKTIREMMKAYFAYEIFRYLSTEDTTMIPLDIKLVKPFVLQEIKNNPR